MTTLKLRDALSNALSDILDFWMTKVVDTSQGRFYGEVSNDNIPSLKAPKSAVLNARILWTFSAAYNYSPDAQYLEMADRAWLYLRDHFIDPVHGGVYWSVDALGKPFDKRKQFYAIAFALYACSEYYKATRYPEAKETAISLFHVIEKYGYDPNSDGYFEACTESWEEPEDFRLSEKDANEKKTMNTHLHIIEAYTNLYSCWKDEYLRQQIKKLLLRFSHSIIDADTGHLHLFFDEQWEVKSSTISYGHDIEAAWLLLDSAIAINDSWLISQYTSLSLLVTETTIREGIDKDGGLWYEYLPVTQQLVKEKHWWPQAEALVGFVNAWQLSGDDKYLLAAQKVWQFIDQYLVDHEKGEWYWGVYEDHSRMPEQKVGFWKCPYHNVRACIETIKRLESSID